MDLPTLAAFAGILALVWVLIAGQRSLAESWRDLVHWWRNRHANPERIQQQPSSDLRPLLATAGALGKLYQLDQQVESLNTKVKHQDAQLLELKKHLAVLLSAPESLATRSGRQSLEPVIETKRREVEQLQREITWRVIPPLSSRIGLVNRERELEAICEAIAMRPDSCILYFVGPGGVGKTRLLEEIGNLQGRIDTPFLWSGIIDMYHADCHTRIGLQDSIIRGLDSSGQYFGAYQSARERLTKQQTVGMAGSLLTGQVAALDEYFIQDYNILAEHSRLVLTFDTIEALEYESGLIRGIGPIQEEVITAKPWLISQFPKLKNTVFILAGRPELQLAQDLEQGLSKTRIAYQKFHLTGLTQGEATKYLKDLIAQQGQKAGISIEPLTPELCKQIWRVTEGRPIRLALTLDLALRGKVDNFFSSISLSTDSSQFLLEGILQRDRMTNCLLRYLALSRKGLDPELLSSLERGWTLDECRDNLNKIKILSFVKSRPGTETLFLHDEVYELFDRHSTLRDQEESHTILRKIVQYYQNKVSELQQILEQTMDVGERQKVIRDSQAWQTHLLYYELEVNLTRGFEECYKPWSDRALNDYEIDFDLQLQNVLWGYLKHLHGRESSIDSSLQAIIHRDAAVRAIWRHLAQGKNADARKIAEGILHSSDSLFNTPAPNFRGELLVAYGESLVYTEDQNSPRIIETLNTAIQLLNSMATPVEPNSSPTKTRYARILARAYNDLGYAYINSWHYREAEDLLQTAIDNYNLIDVQDEKAYSQNNLAYVRALLSQYEAGERLCLQALERWQKTGRRYPAALTQNTLGLIRLMAGKLTQAQTDCELALAVFEELEQGMGSQRGIGLACNALGKIFRARGNEWAKAKPLECLDHFQKAEGLQRRAIQCLNQVDHYYFADSRNELGCVYRDWARLMQTRGHSIQADKMFAKAINELEGAIKEARDSWKIPRADSYEDLARVYYFKGQIPEVQRALSSAEQLVPKDYQLVVGKGFQQLYEAVEGYWLMLGKIYLMYGHIALVMADNQTDHDKQINTAADAYICSLAYLLKFSPHSDFFSKAQHEIVDFAHVYVPGHIQLLLTKMHEAVQAYRLNSEAIITTLSTQLQNFKTGG